MGFGSIDGRGTDPPKNVDARENGLKVLGVTAVPHPTEVVKFMPIRYGAN